MKFLTTWGEVESAVALMNLLGGKRIAIGGISRGRGFCEEIARTGEHDWSRVATRLPSEQRTARWLVRQAMHEGIHHLGDIRRIGETLSEAATDRRPT